MLARLVQQEVNKRREEDDKKEEEDIGTRKNKKDKAQEAPIDLKGEVNVCEALHHVRQYLHCAVLHLVSIPGRYKMIRG